jgi:REP element-mobilizing transposase RayT
MARIARFVRDDQPTVYHVISRTALPGLPIKPADKDYLLNLIRRLARLYFVDVLGFALMDNHFHLVVRVYPESDLSDTELRRRYKAYYGEDQEIAGELMDRYRERLTSLGAFIKDIKQGFTRFYNKQYNRRGYFWGERFKSMIVQDGRTLVNLLAYVDLNPIRAGVVRKPEDYTWCSLGYHLQTGNKGKLLSVDFGLLEWNELDPGKIVRKYREFLYETGAVDAGKGAVIDQKVVEKERKRKYAISRDDRFRSRSRDFTDAGIIGSKELVGEVFDRVKHLLGSKDERKFTPVSGGDGMYSMKRLSGAA